MEMMRYTDHAELGFDPEMGFLGSDILVGLDDDEDGFGVLIFTDGNMLESFVFMVFFFFFKKFCVYVCLVLCI